MKANLSEQVADSAPLYLPERDGTWVPSLHVAQDMARQTLTDYQDADAYDHKQIAGAAGGLYVALRHLVGALDADDALAVAALPDVWRKPVSA